MGKSISPAVIGFIEFILISWFWLQLLYQIHAEFGFGWEEWEEEITLAA